jgi:DNA (cytosine-5)-methyltransferase 1
MKSIARNGKVLTGQANPICAADYKDPDIVAYAAPVQYIVRRLTPTECARLQGFPDRWGDIDEKDELTPEEYRFWLEVRKTHDRINGKKVQDYTREQMLKWYNKLHTDSAEYKMWGNGIALPPALYCMQGIVDAMGKEGGR